MRWNLKEAGCEEHTNSWANLWSDGQKSHIRLCTVSYTHLDVYKRQVLIHDGARPMIDETEIRLSMRAVEEEHACVIGVPVKDTIKVGNAKHYAVDTPDRSCLWAVQTPQSFSYELLMEAYGEMWQAAESGERITDDAMIVERFTGHKVKLVQGKYENIKVTTPEDLLIAEVFLKKAKKMKNCY